MPDFPWEAVYNHFTESLIDSRPEHGPFNPMLATVLTDWTDVVKVSFAPQKGIDSCFKKGAVGQMALHEIIKESVGEIGEGPFCLVFISEAYAKNVAKVDLPNVNKIYKNGLKGDPETRDVLIVQIHRPEGMRMGMLPVHNDGTVTYAPLKSATRVAQNMAQRKESQ